MPRIMEFRKVIRKKVRRKTRGVDIAGDVNAVVAANVGEGDARAHVSSRQRIVQRTGDRPPKDPEGGEQDG